MFMSIMILCTVGCFILSDNVDNPIIKKEEKTDKKENKKIVYDIEYCRNNLKKSNFDYYDCYDIVECLKDDDIKYELEYLLKNNYSFNDSILYLIEKGIIKL